MLFVPSDWFLCLGISSTNHFRAKQDGFQLCLSYGRIILFIINEAVVSDNVKKATKFGIKVFRDMYFVYCSAINALREFKCFSVCSL